MRYGKWKSWFFAFLVFVLAFQCYPAATPVNADRLEETPAMLREAASQGMVLLKNEKAGSNTALPLAKGEKVALFGVGQVSFLPNGRGSSSVVVPYAVSGLEGMRNAAKEGKVSLVEDLSALYQKQVDDKIKDEMELTQSQIDSVAAKADTAIIYITRLSGEASDLTKKDDFVADNRLPLPEYPYNRSYFLSAKEKTMINQVKSAFKKVIVVLNVPSAVDTSWFNKDADIDAALVSWYPGMEGGNAVADVLTGAVNPSAKLPITFAGSLDDYESTKNFGTQTTIYEEDIFVGYRQFETFDPTYQKVNYPFGYGLSYTNFTITSSASASGGNINIQATVKNTGAVAGREVVQVYFSAPQKGTGGAKLSKAAKELACFQKTDMLQPGASQTVNLSFPVSDMASYDDTGVTGHKSAYVLEAGDYKIHVGNSIKKAGENGVKYTYKQSSTQVTEQCTQYLTPVTDFKKLEADGSYSSIAAGTGTADAPVNTNEPYAPPISKITFGQVKNNRKLMEPFIAQIPSETLIEFLCTSVTAGNDLRDYGVPSCRMTDGSLGIRFNKTNDYEHWYPGNILVASTWDLELAQELATQLGKEMLRHEMLWAPALNIMRSPLCGRNFEYYSEDPLVSGKMAAAFNKGLQSQRKSVAMKHFAANNQEAYRTTNNVVATERALREIYLKGFEIAVKEADPWGIMTSYNKINGVYTCQRYDLVTGIPRGEWGYQGFYTTDWGGDAAMTMTNAIKAGNDLRIGNYNEAEAELKASLYSKQLLRQDLELCTKRVLEMFLKTNAVDQTEDAPGSLTIHPSGRNRLVATNYL